jgi:hypothetical protein
MKATIVTLLVWIDEMEQIKVSVQTSNIIIFYHFTNLICGLINFNIVIVDETYSGQNMKNMESSSCGIW